MVNGHDAQGHPTLTFLPRHPVGDATHVDGGEYGIADGAVLEQRLGGAHGLVVAHVLVHGQDDAGGFARFHGLDGLGVIRSQRFLRENTLGRAARAGGLDDL